MSVMVYSSIQETLLILGRDFKHLKVPGGTELYSDPSQLEEIL